MSDKKEKVIATLINRGNELLKRPYEKIIFARHPKADELLNNIKEFPHAYVLACVMGRQIKAEKAWLIPYRVSEEIGGFEFSRLLKLSDDVNKIKNIFNRRTLHRFNDIMAENFCLAVQRIHADYDDNASNIWSDNPSSVTVVRRFLQFKGVGIKIATMAANILVRDFKIPVKDYIYIDISPDVHAKRVFKRFGFVSDEKNNEELIYSARELNPEYPGIFDLSCWEIGREWCHPSNPKCESCYLNEYCLKKI
ncbi:MAG: iron-sulfur cluster loop [Candidatus Omnitrophota bacterium]